MKDKHVIAIFIALLMIGVLSIAWIVAKKEPALRADCEARNGILISTRNGYVCVGKPCPAGPEPVYIELSKGDNHMDEFTEAGKTGGYWYNFKTGEYVHLESFPPAENMPEYIPQIPPAQNMYSALLALNHTPEQALKEVLMTCVAKDIQILPPIPSCIDER